MISKYDLLLLKMVYLNQLYKTDALSLVDDNGNNNSKIIRKMIDRGWVHQREIAKLGATKQTSTVVAITYEGRRYLARKFKDKFYTDIARDIQRPWNTNDPKLLHKRLASNRVKTTMINAGVWTLPPDKPSLTKLYNDAYGKETDASEFYDNSITLDEALTNGVYYSSDEVREYIENIFGVSANDVISGARFKGVYINHDILAMCYIANTAHNKRIKVSQSMETRAIKVLTDCLTAINGSTNMKCIIVSSGNALVEMMCQHDQTEKATNFSLIDWTNRVFNNSNVFPRNKLGVDSLNYMLTHDYDAWKQDSYAIYKSIPFMHPIYDHIGNPNLIGRNSQTNNRVIFIPWYDLNILRFIKEFHEPIDIVTRDDMAQTIANVIGKPLAIYDLQGNPILVEVQYKAPKEKKRIKHMVSFNISLGREDRNKIKTIAKINGQSMSSYVRGKVKENLDKDYELAMQKLESEKRLRRKIRKSED